MPGMKVTLNTAMRVRDVSKPLPNHDDDARAKVAEWPGPRPRPAPAQPPAHGRTADATPGPWRPGGERVEAPTPRTGSGHGKEQARPTPQAPRGTDQRPPAPIPRGTGQRPAPPRSGDQRPAAPPGG